MKTHIRRVVTGMSEHGKSCVLFDGAPSNTFEPVPGMVFSDLWETQAPPNSTIDRMDTADRPVRLEPVRGGTILKAVTFPPVSSYDEADWKEVYEAIGATSGTNAGDSMHKTATVDYVVVLRGEIYCVLEEGEVLLKEGDVLVQRGTNHGWENRSNRPCLILGVMVNNSGVVTP